MRRVATGEAGKEPHPTVSRLAAGTAATLAAAGGFSSPSAATPRRILGEPRALRARTRSVTIVRRILGAALVLTGVVWVGQGLDLIQGSSMTGSTFWAVVGGICLAAGLGLLSWPWRRQHA